MVLVVHAIFVGFLAGFIRCVLLLKVLCFDDRHVFYASALIALGTMLFLVPYLELRYWDRKLREMGTTKAARLSRDALAFLMCFIAEVFTDGFFGPLGRS